MQNILAKYNIKPQRIAVAVSGGADSLALVFMAAEQLSVFGYKIIALTVNHNLRPSAEDEAQYVARIMKNHHIEHHILHWTEEKPQTGIEEAARSARYNLLFDWCREHNVKVLMTAHHLNDQAETFLMRLQRGSGLEGLCCMREVTERNGITVVRPLLYVSPASLKTYLTQKNIRWIQDESNSDTHYLRNRIRAFLPQMEAAAQISPHCLASTAQRLQSAEDYIEKNVEAVIADQVQSLFDTVHSFKYTDFLRWHPEIKFRILAKLCRRDYIPRAERVCAAISQIAHMPFEGLTLGGKEIFKAYDRVWIVPELNAKRKASRQAWKEFVAAFPQYKNIKIPHKARVAVLQNMEKADDL